MSARGDLDIVKAGLIDRIEDVCRRLLPAGRLEGGLWVSHNPRVAGDDRKTPAFKVRVRGGDVGAWKDWRSPTDKGDALALVAYLIGADTKGALAWSRDFLGLQPMSAADRERFRRDAEQKARARDEAAERRRLKKLLDADRLFNAKPSERETGPAWCPQGTFAFGAGSPAEIHARKYFAARAMPIDDFAARYTFRFSPATEWWRGARWKNEDGRRWKEERGPLFPAVHSAMRNRLGIVTACHLTFLDPTLPAKAPVGVDENGKKLPAKLMYGEAGGAVIEIARGPGGFAFWQAPEDCTPHPLIIGEGIESVGPFAREVPEARVWAGGSLDGIAKAPVDLDCISWILFARDNNHGNAQAQRQFEAAHEQLLASGKPVHVEASHVGDDFNDLARGEE